MKIFGNAYNILAYAIVTALNPVGSTKFDRVVVSRSGGGLVNMTGAYTGQSDAVFDVEIRNADITGDPRVSSPRFSGVGNGVMSGVVADSGASAQQITVTLKDLGTDTRSAYTPFQGKTLRAKRAGPDANYIQITVDESTIVRTPTDKALLAELQAGNNSYIGDQWDFGALPRNPDGTIPAGCPRISFGSDPAVYRQYKVFAAGQYVYGFTPVPLRSAPIGARVNAITGGRTVTVTHTAAASASVFSTGVDYPVGGLTRPTTPTGHWYEATGGGIAGTEPVTWPVDGTTVTTGAATFIDRGVITNAYADIVTLYDALAAIEGDADSLIAVDDSVVLDYNEGGMAITDLAVRTSAYIQSIVADGGDVIRSFQLTASVLPGAPMEDVVVKCNAGGTANAEVWDVRGTVSGMMAQAVTGVPYEFGSLSLLIPLLPANEIAPTTEVSWDFETQYSGEPKPAACVEDLILGADAQQRVFTFEWKKRVATCDCDSVDVNGEPNPIFLGITPEVTQDVDVLDPEIKTRVQRSASWYSAFTTSNTSLTPIAGSSEAGYFITDATAGSTLSEGTVIEQKYSAILRSDIVDISLALKLRNSMCTLLIDLKKEFDSGTIPTAATDLWDDLQDLIEADLLDFEDAIGAGFWYDVAQTVNEFGAGGSLTDAIAINRRAFTSEFTKLLPRYLSKIDDIWVAADRIPPSFDSPTGGGSGPWSDHNGPGWFVAKDSNLMPIQPGYGYHSAKEVFDADGNVEYVSTREFYVGMNIGCPEGLTEGDLFKIIIGDTGTSTRGYQMGDNYQIKIVSGSPVQLGGGQIGNDTQLWGVLSSTAGARPDYAQLKTAPATYATAHPGEDFDFLIGMGQIANRLGDQFVFFIEGGEFRWRMNAGSWSADTPIESTVALSGGLGVSLAFNEGIAPSFVAGDTYQFSALAINGGGNLSSLTQGGIVTTQFVESTITKHRIEANLDAAGKPAESASDCLILFQEPTEVGATVTLRGFTDAGDAEGAAVIVASALTNGSQQLLIKTGSMTACEKWTVTYYSTANTPATLGWRWGFIGSAFEMQLQNHRESLGETVQEWTLPKRARRRSGMGLRVDFTASGQQSVEDLRYILEHASIEDHGRVVALCRESVPAPTRARDAFGSAHTAYPEAGPVTIDADSMKLSDEFKFQSDDPLRSLIALDLVLSAVR